MDDLRIKDIEDAYDLRMKQREEIVNRLVDEYIEKSRRDNRRFCLVMLAFVSIVAASCLILLFS